MEGTNEDVQSLSSCSQWNTVRMQCFTAAHKLFVIPGQKEKKELLVSVHSLDATF